MARITVVKRSRARKDGRPRTCEVCKKEIPTGDGYKWCAPGFRGPDRTRCLSCPSWKPSELTGSAGMAAALAAQEAAWEDLAKWTAEDGYDGLNTILATCAEGLREGAEAFRESASNIEDGFGHATSASEEFEEKADMLESSADEVENASIEEWDEDAAREEIKRDNPKSNDEELESLYDVKLGEWAEEARNTAEEAVNNIEMP